MNGKATSLLLGAMAAALAIMLLFQTMEFLVLNP
jgi:hypothetical protein